MKITENIVSKLRRYIENKKVLEVACGDSDFSLYSSKYAAKVLATDISLERFNQRNINSIPNNIGFKEMNAANLTINDRSYDVTTVYNGLGHLEDMLSPVLKEMRRVTKTGGYLIFISTWSMDKKIHSSIENIVDQYNNLEISENIEKTKYKILIVQKI